MLLTLNDDFLNYNQAYWCYEDLCNFPTSVGSGDQQHNKGIDIGDDDNEEQFDRYVTNDGSTVFQGQKLFNFLVYLLLVGITRFVVD